MACTAITKAGNPCMMPTVPGATLCRFHDPVHAKADRAAGGRARAVKAVLPDADDLPLANVADVVALLGLTVNQVRRGELDVKVSNAIAYLSATLLRALHADELQEQVEAVVRILRAQGHKL